MKEMIEVFLEIIRTKDTEIIRQKWEIEDLQRKIKELEARG